MARRARAGKSLRAAGARFGHQPLAQHSDRPPAAIDMPANNVIAFARPAPLVERQHELRLIEIGLNDHVDPERNAKSARGRAVTLFRRKNRSIELTAAGESY